MNTLSKYDVAGSCPMKLSSITVDPVIQQRQAMNQQIVDDYSEAIGSDSIWPFPPLTVFQDGDIRWLVDGFHRIAAAHSRGLKQVPVDWRRGPRDEAILFAVGANAAHGLQRSNSDKRKAVMTMLEHPEWSQWSDREIARRCRVHHQMVSKIRGATQLDDHPDETIPQLGNSPGETAQLAVAASAPDEPAIKPIIRKGKDGRVRDVSGIQKSNIRRSKPKVTPKKAAVQAYHRFGGACQDLRKVKLSAEQKFEVAEHCRDTLIWCMKDMQSKDIDLMVEKICNRSEGELGEVGHDA